MVANLPVVDLADGGLLKLWIESAHQSLVETGGDVISTFQTKEQFFAVVVSGLALGLDLGPERQRFLMLEKTPLGTVVENILAALPGGEHVPFSILQVLEIGRALVECDAPPLFMTRGWGVGLAACRGGRIPRTTGSHVRVLSARWRPRCDGQRGVHPHQRMEPTVGLARYCHFHPATDRNPVRC